MFCQKCGTELLDDQGKCPNCEIEAVSNNNEDVHFEEISNNEIDQQNFNEINSSNNKKVKKILIITIPIAITIIIAAVILIIVLSANSLNGKYVNISGESGTYYKFEDSKFTKKNDDGFEYGKYEFDGDFIVLTDSDGDNITFYKEGVYIFKSKVHFDDKLNNITGNTTNQKITKNFSTTYKGETLSYVITLSLSYDGSYTKNSKITYSGISLSDQTVNGNYEIKKNLLFLTSIDGEKETLYIKDNIVYDEVYKKE